MKGYSFRRQRPILNYVADFACLKLLLVIEIDGSYHLREDVQKKRQIQGNSFGKHWIHRFAIYQFGGASPHSRSKT